MLNIEEIADLHTQWDRYARIHRKVVALDDRAKRCSMYWRLLEEDPSLPAALIGLATSASHPEMAMSFVQRLLELGMRQEFVLKIIAKILRGRPELYPWFERWRKEPGATISAAMIVKDEEHVLGRCLDNILPFVDQCVIVDTGSTDGTVELAESYGVEVVHHPWEDDFAKSRNQSLEYVTSDWVMWIDADEVVEKGSWAEIHAIIKEPGTQAIHLNVVSEYGDGTEVGVTPFPRVWRHDPRCILRWPVYEDISWSLYPLAQRYFRKVVESPHIRILHDGYHIDSPKAAGKSERYRHMMRGRVDKDPRDKYARSHYAAMLRAQGDLGGAATQYEEWMNQYAHSLIVVGDTAAAATFSEFGECLADLGRHDQANVVLTRGEQLVGPSARGESARRYCQPPPPSAGALPVGTTPSDTVAS